MMTRKRYTQYLPLVAAMLALTAASAFAVAPIIDELPRVVIGGTNTFSNAVNLDAYIDWFPVTVTEPWGANRDYPGHASKNAAYVGKNRFHVYVYDPAAGRTLTNAVTGAESQILLTGPSTALPANANSDMYGVDPYTGPVKMSVAYSAVPAVQTSASIDVFAVVEGAVAGNQIVAGYAPMTVVTGGANNQVGYAIQFVTGRANDSFFYWIPGLWPAGGGVTPVPPRGRDLVNTTWANKALRNQNSIIGWNISGYTPSGANIAIGVFEAAAKTGTAAYGDFIPNAGGGTTAPVFQVKARLVSSAPTYVGSPGYRVGFLNAASTHTGMVQVVTDQPSLPFGYLGSGPGQRTNGHDFIARCYWSTPSNLTDMGDSGRIKPFGPGIVIDNADPTDPIQVSADGRDYGIEIMCIAKSTSVGEFIVDALSVTTIADGDLVTSTTASWTKEWKGAVATGGLTPLTAATWGIAYWPGPVGTGITPGYGTIESNALLLWGAKDARRNLLANLPTAGTFRVVKAGPLDSPIAAVSNALYRTTYTVQSGGMSGDGNAQFSPCIQIHSYISNTGGAIDWYETWGPQATYLKDPANRPAGALTPGVPPSTATPVRSYMWTHTLTGANRTVQPEITVYNTGIWNTPAWKDADGYYKFTDIKMQRIANVR